jgi:hypothetical protein
MATEVPSEVRVLLCALHTSPLVIGRPTYWANRQGVERTLCESGIESVVAIWGQNKREGQTSFFTHMAGLVGGGPPQVGVACPLDPERLAVSIFPDGHRQKKN